MLREFVRRIFSRWFTAMSGPLSVPAAFAAAYASTPIARMFFGATAVACLVITAYWAWRAEHVEVLRLREALDPKLSIEFDGHRFPFVARTTLTGALVGMDGVVYVRVLPKCRAQVTNCHGVLMRVMRLDGSEWVPTAYSEAQTLIWSNHPDPADKLIRLDPDIEQFLDVFRISQFSGSIEVPLLGGRVPNNALGVFQNGGTFRFDVAVVGDQQARAVISLKVKTATEWDKAEIETFTLPPSLSARS